MPALRTRRSCLLATWLSLVALCAALLAPASVLARELSQGHWQPLCSATRGTWDANPAPLTADAGEGGHCGLCALPGLALPPEPPVGSPAPADGVPPILLGAAGPSAWVLSGPFIRGPPAWL